ncbi:MAG TPA: alpha/beta fold hydrolase [Dactylosporangium sp.]|nr:alpha/beta fold hydrolase [Dactylosporangium sp.]
MDLLFADRPVTDGPRAAMSTPVFDSDGVRLPGVLLTPAGDGPHPLVLMLNGFPGNERNADVAQALRRVGFAVLTFHYRGSWGTGGAWSWGNVLADVRNVLASVREGALSEADAGRTSVDAGRTSADAGRTSADAGRTSADAGRISMDAGRISVDAGQISLVGHSLGGFAALMTAAGDPHIRAVAAIAPFDLGAAGQLAAVDSARRVAYETAFGEELLPLTGTSGPALVAEMRQAGAAWGLAGLAERLGNRPVLLVGADRDTVAEPDVHFRPLVDAYAHLPGFRHARFDTDHALSDSRVGLTTTLASFLTALRSTT